MQGICFIIACKYNRNYQSYLKYYVDNIQKFYNDSYTILVDNNSKHIQDIFDIFKDYNNMIILINNSECKFEIGAYNEGIRYIMTNDLIHKFNYFVFSQDNFVLKNKFDFNELKKQNTLACAFNHFKNDGIYNNNLIATDPICIKILEKIKVYDKTSEFNLCWCNSFIVHRSKLIDYYNIVKDEIILTRLNGSVQSERYLSGILYYLNNYKYESICGEIETPETLGYDCWTVDLVNDNLSNYFVKKVQQKTENTIDE